MERSVHGALDNKYISAAISIDKVNFVVLYSTVWLLAIDKKNIINEFKPHLYYRLSLDHEVS